MKIPVGFLILIIAIHLSVGQDTYFGKPAGPAIIAAKTFWKKIYAEIDSNSTVIFDKYSLTIYGICKNNDSVRVLDSIRKAVRSPQRVKSKTGRREFIADAIIRAKKYPFIADTLRAYGLHPDLKWLPVLESGYLDTMVSEAGARGIWQFIVSTGRIYGLSKNDITDPYASTGAFTRYFSKLYDEFNDYGLALTAYNCGEQRVRRIVEKRRAASLDKIAPDLGFEARNYYARFLAILDIVKNRQGMDSVQVPERLSR
jgi:hypothetical protein